MKPRITFCLRDGALEMYFNPAGRALFIEKLSRLNEKNDHFHFAPSGINSEMEVSSLPYKPEDKILEFGKVLFRTDEWDRQYYPDVMPKN